MAASYQTIRGTFKIAAIYAFALTTAVACSKFEVAGTKISPAPGNLTVTRDGATGGAPTEFTVNIEKITATILPQEDVGQFAALKVDMAHGDKKMSINVFPMIAPTFLFGQVKRTTGTVEYTVEGVCANATCTKYGVLINVVDSSNGSDFQRVETWNLDVSTTAPQKRVTQTAFSDVATAYEALAFEKLNPTP